MNDNPDFGRDDEGTGNTNQGEGQVRLAGTSVSVSVDVLSRADGKAINTDDYIIRIYSTDNNLLVKEYTCLLYTSALYCFYLRSVRSDHS